jgi:hypothetical protein
MNGSSSTARPPRAAWLPRLATGIVFVLSLGFLLHTSHRPVVFGKYGLRYAVFLAALFLIVLPAFYWLARFCTVTDEMTLSRGRRLPVRPRHKLTFLLLAATGLYLAFGLVQKHAGILRVTTFDAHIFHPYLQNVPTPNHAGQHINRWGFRGEEIERQKSDDVFRIFVFGGSTVHCGTVPFEQTHCRVLERRLREAYPEYRIEVQNLGAEWHATEHDTIKLLFYAQDFSPDLAIMFHGINDLVRGFVPDMFAEGEYRPDYGHYYGAVSNLATQGRKAPMFFNAVVGHWCSDLRFDVVRVNGPDGEGLSGINTLFYPKTRPVQIAEWKSLPSFRRNMKDFLAIARLKGIEPLLATQASLYRDDLTPAEQELLGFPLSHHFDGKRASLKSMIDGMRTFNDATRQIAHEAQVRLVDLERMMPKTTAYLYDDIHYTKAGNELIGHAFADEIVEWGLVEKTMRERAAKREVASSSLTASP